MLSCAIITNVDQIFLKLLILGGACAARVTVVGSVCLSVNQHLTSGVSVRLENAIT